MNKLEKFKNLLQEILVELEKERANISSIWRRALLDNIVKPEISKLFEYAQKGEIYFQYGQSHSQRMLQSTYYITDAIEALDKTSLGQAILNLQKIYDKL